MGMRSIKSSASKVPMEVSKMAMGLDEAAAANCLVIAVGRVTRGRGARGRRSRRRGGSRVEPRGRETWRASSKTKA